MHMLWTHPNGYALRIREMGADVDRLSETVLRFRYRVIGDLEALVFPPPATPLRANKLWKTTCFEAFLKPVGGESYREFNFSPSGQWAAYDFDSYRSGMTEAWLPVPPDMVLQCDGKALEVTVTLSLDLPDEPYRLALAAVIEERDFSLSYWAAGHAPDYPDFHHDSCFVLELPPAPAS
jgi:hypothetical protein